MELIEFLYLSLIIAAWLFIAGTIAIFFLLLRTIIMAKKVLTGMDTMARSISLLGDGLKFRVLDIVSNIARGDRR